MHKIIFKKIQKNAQDYFQKIKKCTRLFSKIKKMHKIIFKKIQK